MILIINNEQIFFKKLNNILYSNLFHLYYDNNYLLNNSINIIDERLQCKIYFIKNPKYLFLSLYANKNNKIKFGLFNKHIKFKWIFENNYIKNKLNNLYLSTDKDNIYFTKEKINKWFINNNKLVSNEYYLSCDYNYQIYLTKDYYKAIDIHINNNNLHFFKTKLLVDFELNNLKYNIVLNEDYINNYNNNYGILLSAGFNTRFNSDIPKIFYKYKNEELIIHSIKKMLNLKKIIIITNSDNYNELYDLINKYNFDNIIILINDINDRLESLNIGIEYIKDNFNKINNIVIHDSARPFIKDDYISKIINTKYFSQYYLKLTNGLIDKSCNILNRDNYLELCTPICINYNLLYFIFYNYMYKERKITDDFINIINLLNINYELIEGKLQYLRKITYIEDLVI